MKKNAKKLSLESLQIINKLQSVLENLRLDHRFDKQIRSKVKYDQYGKIDVKRIIWDMNNNKKMKVDPHNFDI